MNDQIDWTSIDNARPMGLDYTPKTPQGVAFSEALGDTLAALETHRKNQRRGKRQKAFNDAAGALDRPPLKWSTLSYGFGSKEDRDAKEDLQAGRDCREAAAG